MALLQPIRFLNDRSHARNLTNSYLNPNALFYSVRNKNFRGNTCSGIDAGTKSGAAPNAWTDPLKKNRNTHLKVSSEIIYIELTFTPVTSISLRQFSAVS